MAKIHGLVYIVVGLFVSILSLKLNYQRFIVFFYAGLVFIVFGVIKLIFNLIKSKSNKTKDVHHKIEHKQQIRSQQHFRYCPKCRNIMKLHDRFCSRCGFRI